ncbi:MAG: carbonic anhydrase [Spirochaetes bacterium GWB1_48_6]|nr:MAG: carbonic anhydrase [Spirochaetes bacterium GWB1_48_6]
MGDLDKILEGLVEFRQNDFENHKDLFQDLSKIQKPHTLFIGCSDSRVVPEMMTKSLPGELFMVRNVANLVPRFRLTQEYVATTSAIEYAVQILDIKNIIVCGHSNCGGCAALYFTDEQMKKIPNTKKWLELAAPIKARVLNQVPDNNPQAREWLTEQMNIVEQLKNLLTYPYILERVEAGTLTIHGWYYIIETGEVFSYDRNMGYFEKLN